jgi:hypothetical protein
LTELELLTSLQVLDCDVPLRSKLSDLLLLGRDTLLNLLAWDFETRSYFDYLRGCRPSSFIEERELTTEESLTRREPLLYLDDFTLTNEDLRRKRGVAPLRASLTRRSPRTTQIIWRRSRVCRGIESRP